MPRWSCWTGRIFGGGRWRLCGDPAARHGIVLAKNEAAKAFGVKTAETIWQARRKCPQLVLLPAHHEKYRHYSKLAGALYARYTDLVEPFGIDESWLDVTGTLHLFGGDPQGPGRPHPGGDEGRAGPHHLRGGLL